MTYLISIIIIAFFYKKYSVCLYNYELNSYTRLKGRRNFCYIVSGILTLLLILRNDYFGTDTQNYHNLFDYHILYYFNPSLSDIKLSSEWGFYSLVYYLKSYDFSFRYLLVISAVSYMSSVTYLIYRYSENVVFSYFIFFTYNFWVFNTTMRQCFALTFIIIAVICALNKRVLLYTIFTILAILFHSSAIVCIPIYYVLRMKLSKANVIFFTLIMLIVSVMASSIYVTMQELTGKEYEVSDTGGYVRTFAMILLLIIGWINREKLTIIDETILKLFFIALCLQPIAQLNSALFRVNQYFYFFIILLAPNLVKKISSYKHIIATFYIVYGIYGFTLGSYKAGIRVIPYVYAWENYFDENTRVKRADFN